MLPRQSNIIVAISKELDCTYLEAMAFADRMSARGYEFALRDWIADAAEAMEAQRAGGTKSRINNRAGDRRSLSRPRVRTDDLRTSAPDAPHQSTVRVGTYGVCR